MDRYIELDQLNPVVAEDSGVGGCHAASPLIHIDDNENNSEQLSGDGQEWVPPILISADKLRQKLGLIEREEKEIFKKFSNVMRSYTSVFFRMLHPLLNHQKTVSELLKDLNDCFTCSEDEKHPLDYDKLRTACGSIRMLISELVKRIFLSKKEIKLDGTLMEEFLIPLIRFSEIDSPNAELRDVPLNLEDAYKEFLNIRRTVRLEMNQGKECDSMEETEDDNTCYQIGIKESRTPTHSSASSHTITPIELLVTPERSQNGLFKRDQHLTTPLSLSSLFGSVGDSSQQQKSKSTLSTPKDDDERATQLAKVINDALRGGVTRCPSEPS